MDDALIPHTSSIERHRRIIEENNMKKLKLVHSNNFPVGSQKHFQNNGNHKEELQNPSLRALFFLRDP